MPHPSNAGAVCSATRAALLAALFPAFSNTAIAAEQPLETVVVTATRFNEPDPGVSANITVITGQDIRNTPAQNLPDVLGTRAGIDVRHFGGGMGRDAVIDMRGFGATAGSNTLILLDGQRVNPVDLGSIIWSSIPLESVERVEVIRGSGTVLYGDGASGGVINIITKKSARPVAAVTGTIGSYGYKGADIQFGNGNDQAYYRFFLSHADADGYRKNSQQDQQAGSGRVGWLFDAGELFADFAAYQESSGQPGAIFSAAYRDEPRSTRFPRNTEARDGYRLRPGVSYRINDRLTLESEVGFEHQTLDGRFFASYGNTASSRVRDTTSFTPRLRWRHDLGVLASETVVGFDYYDGKVDSNNTGFADQGAKQESAAFYLQNVSKLTSHLSLTVGARRQRMKQSAHQDAYAPYFSPAIEGNATRTRSAYDVGLAYAGDGWRVYGKTGTTFRFANLDELFGQDAFFNPVFVGDLKPQHGRISEIGGSVAVGPATLRASAYQLDLSDEIGYDSALFANVNFDPTRRRGAELEADWRISTSLSAKMSYAYTDARFRSGAYDGNTVPLAPRQQLGAQMTWNAGQAGTYSAAVRHVGDRRYGSDFANAQGMLAGYTTLDLQAAWDLKPWKITAKVLNATDRKYAPIAGYSAFYHDTYFYPADARGFFVAGRYDF